MARSAREVPFAELDYRHDPAEWPFETTADLDHGDPSALQPRAAAALDFGLDLEYPDYHLFVAGPAGAGRHTFLQRELHRRAAQRPVPDDWCYVHNFAAPDRPLALRLPPGRGEELRRALERCVNDARADLRRALESEPYRERRQELRHEAERRTEALLSELQSDGREQGFLLQPVPVGMASVPLNPEGEPYTEEEFDALPEEQRREIERRSEELQRRVEQVVSDIRRLERETNERLEEVDREVARWAVSHPIDLVREQFRGSERLDATLDALADDMVENRQLLSAPERGAQDPHLQAAYENLMGRYRANPFVTHAADGGAPVIFEQHPTYYNLVGRSEYRFQLSGMVTDVSQIRPGALQRANGGYLVLDVLDVLLQPFAWEALKRSLTTREARLENIAEQFSLLPVSMLKPEPVPLQLRVVLVGRPLLYYLLYAYDEEFRRLFKVKADFDHEAPRRAEIAQAYAEIIAHCAHREQLPPLDRAALSRVLDHALRLRDDTRRLSTLLGPLTDTVREAAAWAKEDGAAVVRAEHVERAIRQREYRADLLEEKVLDRLEEGVFMVAVTGAEVGQVNGLSVVNLGDHVFGRPVRITARTSFGRGGVVDVERESELGGRLHSKGVLILAGYLSGQYGREMPLPLAASLCFEQSYEEMEGDSASSAELYALLSSLAGAPLRQDVAVTGSVNQHGVLQPVGGVTQKVEAFFKTCQRKGLTGEQGVLLPELNLPHLVLRGEVLDAVREGRFHLWAARTVDEGIALLTGVPAGEADDAGRFPPETIHGRARARLEGFLRQLKELGGLPEAAPLGDGRRRVRPRAPAGPASPPRRARRRARRAE